MSNVSHLHQMIDALADLIEDQDESFIASIARGCLQVTENALRSAVKTITEYNDGYLGSVEDSLVTPESLTEMAAIAAEFDKSGDPMLMKQAQVLDEILLTIGAQKEAVTAAKRAQDEEITRLKSLAAEKEDSKKDTKDPYTVAKKFHDKDNHVAEGQAAIDKVKEFRPMEAPLNTRTCPDHPGAQMARVAENTYQCSLDKGIYNYENGYTTMRGNKVPGGDVSNQTQALHDRPNEFTSFETRESKLNPN